MLFDTMPEVRNVKYLLSMKILNRIAIVIFIAVVGFIIFKVSKDSNRKFYTTEDPQLRTINDNLFIHGFVYPIREVDVKSQLSGVLGKLFVSVGDKVKRDDPIATVTQVPNSSSIEQLENSLKLAQIEHDAQLVEYKRCKLLFSQRVIALSDLEIAEKNYKVCSEKLRTAINQLNILKRGDDADSNISNMVRSSTDGVVIGTPISEGASVVERNNYSEGTTLVILADMKRFVFRAQVAEQYLDRISKGSEMLLTFNAYDSLRVKAKVTEIAAKGIESSGLVKFSVDAEFEIVDDMPFLRSGYSSTAEVLLDKVVNVISINEQSLFFEDNSTFVYLLDSVTNVPIKREVRIGLSDSKFVELLSGISLLDKVITNYSD